MKYLLFIALVLCLACHSISAQTAKEGTITTDCTLADIHKDLAGVWEMNYKGVNGTMSIIVGTDNSSFSGAYTYPDRKGGSAKGIISGSIETGKDSKMNCCYKLSITWTDGGAEPARQGQLLQVRGSKEISGSIGSTSLRASKRP
jgi:hypothetical protein